MPKERSRAQSSTVRYVPYIKEKNNIELHYGIEIECVLELIDTLTTYIYFMDYYFNMYERKEGDDKKFNEGVNMLIFLIDNSDIDLSSNDVYKKLHEIYITDDKRYNVLFEGFFLSLLKDVNKGEKLDENLKFIEDFKEFINEIIEIFVKQYDPLKISPELKQKYYDFFNMFIIGADVNEDSVNISDLLFDIFHKRFDLSKSNLKIYNSKMLDLTDFYKSYDSDIDNLHLYLTADASVNCKNNLVYTTIKSGNAINYKHLLNYFEFITQVFNNIDDIEHGLSKFFNDPTINSKLLNCPNTSNHVHISFNKNNNIIRPDIYIVLAIVCICRFFQDDIFKLFLITRSDNVYCQKLNFNFFADFAEITNYDIASKMSYDDILKVILELFFKNDEIFTIKDNRYYWLNLINLYNKENIASGSRRPYTIEFRIKHGSVDAEELKYCCILYQNIINYAIELSTKISGDAKGNIITFKETIEELINTEGKDHIYHTKILNNIYDYFIPSQSPYVKGLKSLNKFYPKTITTGGNNKILNNFKKLNITNGGASPIIVPKIHVKTADLFINAKIIEFETIALYKRNSFGFQFIGYGFDKFTIEKLKKYFQDDSSKTSDIDKFNMFLNDNNMFYII